jgi:hypothetical protein
MIKYDKTADYIVYLDIFGFCAFEPRFSCFGKLQLHDAPYWPFLGDAMTRMFFLMGFPLNNQ